MAKNNYVFQVYQQDGFILNPNIKVINGVLKGLNRCDGKCPCYHTTEDETPIPDEDLKCPCKEFRENKHCRCNLYVESKDNTSVLVKEMKDRIEALEAEKIELQTKLQNSEAESKEANQKLKELDTPKRSSSLVY